MHSRYRVALVVIARDEAPRIERLLHSVAPWVDTMLVLDTGSTDATPALASACGARVVHGDWHDDFARARNAALDAAQADWHLVLDADEWLQAGGDTLLALRDLVPGFVGAVRFDDRFHDRLHDGNHDGALRSAQSWMSRVFPGHLRYRGRVHEQVVHALPVQRLAIEVGHDGYLPDRLQAKRGRNRVLLEAELADRPDDAYVWYQLGKDCAVYDEHAPAEAAFAQAAALSALSEPSERQHGWWPDLVVRRLYGLKQLKRHAEAMDVADGQIDRCGELPDFWFALGDLLLDAAADAPAQAPTLLPMIEDAWRRCLAIGERPDLEGTVAGRGSWLAAHNLALVLEITGRSAEAAALRARHPAPATR